MTDYQALCHIFWFLDASREETSRQRKNKLALKLLTVYILFPIICLAVGSLVYYMYGDGELARKTTALIFGIEIIIMLVMKWFIGKPSNLEKEDLAKYQKWEAFKLKYATTRPVAFLVGLQKKDTSEAELKSCPEWHVLLDAYRREILQG